MSGRGDARGNKRAKNLLSILIPLALVVTAGFLLSRLSAENQAAPPASPPPAQKAAGVFASAAGEPTPKVGQTPAPAEKTVPAPEPAPIKTGSGYRELGEIAPSARTDRIEINLKQRIIANDVPTETYARENPIHMGPPETYAALPGVTTFRSNHYRDNSAYGLVPANAKKLTIEWVQRVGGIGDWSGVGWTGQASIVKWPEDVKAQMNITPAKKKKEGLREVIIAALDGKIRFLDLDDGKETRGAIAIGAPIKGSVTVDPRGYPLLYCGQGIFEIDGKTVKCLTRIFSLINQKVLYALDGNDKFKARNWYCFDAAPLIDGATDTMLQVGENGLVYSVSLNTHYDRAAGTISVNPEIDRYDYRSKVTTRPGIENSMAVYNHYGYFVDNSGLLTCLDLNTMRAGWVAYVGDDTDATCAIEETDEGVFLYTGNEVDLRRRTGYCQMRAFDALTGEEKWKVDAKVAGRQRSGAFASPAIGKGALKDLVFFNISKTGQGSTVYALNKKNGDTLWTLGLDKYSWSTPSLLYDASGKGYMLIGNSRGVLRLVNASSGKVITELDLKTNIEGSPALYDDMAVVSTRGGRIYGIRIT